MSEVKYGRVEGNGRGREYPVAADQYMHRLGGKMIYFDAGNITMCASDATEIAGWASSPKCTTGYNAWKSSSTAETDKVFVTYNIDDVYEMPYDQSYEASVAASLVGLGARPHLSGSTYTQIQQAQYTPTDASSLLTIVDVDTVNNTVQVKIRPLKKQNINS